MDKKFTIAEQYKLYLQRMNLPEDKMHPVQKRQLKQTFYGAWGQSMIHMRDEIAAESEDDGIAVIEAQMKEVAEFFIKETNRQN